jgi:hypothetical protein
MAALNCTKLGARGGIATVAEAERLMAAGSRHVNAAYQNGPGVKSRALGTRKSAVRTRRS